MSYTVKSLAKLSGVTERTLRWYDTVGILKPSFYGNNGYRYYEKEELLVLQQILFYRELDFSLDEIKKIITGSDFDKISALNVHKKDLQRSLERTNELIKTIDKTLLHIRGKKMIEDKDIYKGFHEWSKGKSEKSFVLGACDDLKTSAEKLVFENLKKHSNANCDKAYFEKIEKTGTEIYEKLTLCMQAGSTSTSDDVQELIQVHHIFTEQFHHAGKNVYKALAELYLEKSEFRKQLDAHHPKLAEFLSKAMEVFADKNLS